MSVAVVGETPHELIVLKPAGLVCEAPRDPTADSLLQRLAHDGFGGLRLAHRLDAPACGLVLIARTKDAAAFHAADIAARRWQKRYVARVSATPSSAAELIGPHKAYLKTDGRVARVVHSGGKPSFLDVLASSPVPGSDTESHVLVALHSGRFHQIRAMLAHLGAPLWGDERYGGPPATPFYLEHVVLATRLFGAATDTVWTAPAHPNRDVWSPEMAAAVEAAAADLSRSPRASS